MVVYGVFCPWSQVIHTSNSGSAQSSLLVLQVLQTLLRRWTANALAHRKAAHPPRAALQQSTLEPEPLHLSVIVCTQSLSALRACLPSRQVGLRSSTGWP